MAVLYFSRPGRLQKKKAVQRLDRHGADEVVLGDESSKSARSKVVRLVYRVYTSIVRVEVTLRFRVVINLILRSAFLRPR